MCPSARLVNGLRTLAERPWPRQHPQSGLTRWRQVGGPYSGRASTLSVHRPSFLAMTLSTRRAALLLAVSGLAACASNPGYGPADKASDLGYRSQTIEEGRYRISYRGQSLTDAEDGALRRAAEVAVDTGADWFTVVSRSADGGGQRVRGGPSVGIGGSTGGRRGGVGLGVSLPLGGGTRSAPVTVSMEIVTGLGEKPGDPQSYDARSVLVNVAPA